MEARLFPVMAVGISTLRPRIHSGCSVMDSRFISKWVLTLNSESLTALSTDDLQYFESKFFLAPSTGSIYVNSKMSVIRQRSVTRGFHEELTVMNHDDHPVSFELRIDVDADFADLFEVKDNLPKKGAYSKRVANNSLTIGYKRETYTRATTISSSNDGAVDDDGFTFRGRSIRMESGRRRSMLCHL